MRTDAVAVEAPAHQRETLDVADEWLSSWLEKQDPRLIAEFGDPTGLGDEGRWRELLERVEAATGAATRIAVIEQILDALGADDVDRDNITLDNLMEWLLQFPVCHLLAVRRVTTDVAQINAEVAALTLDDSFTLEERLDAQLYAVWLDSKLEVERDVGRAILMRYDISR